MKNLLPLFIILLICGRLHAQQVRTTITRTNYAVDENSVIKDSSGRQITKIEFYEAVVSGNYQFKPVKDKAGNVVEYVLIRCEKKDNNIKINVSSSSQCAPTTVLTVGQLAPEFYGKDMTDTMTYDFNYYKGRKVVVLNFWFTTCAPCVRELPDLNRLYDRYKDRADIVFVAPTFEFAENIDSFLVTHPFNYPILPEAYEAIKNYKAVAYPLNVIIDFDGRIAYVSAGGLPGIEYLLDKKIRDLLGINKDLGPKGYPVDAARVNPSTTSPINTSATSPANTESSPAGGTMISSHPVKSDTTAPAAQPK
jgi:thiol-disulfide isomerase/thioredoxin